MSQLEHEMEEILHDWDSLEIEADDENSRYEAPRQRMDVHALGDELFAAEVVSVVGASLCWLERRATHVFWELSQPRIMA